MATIQWFPGHMAKALRQIREQMPLVDIVFELVDARVPYSTQNPEVALAAGEKPRLLIMTKTDLADQSRLQEWRAYFRQKGQPVLALDSRRQNVAKLVTAKSKEILHDKMAEEAAKGLKKRPIRAKRREVNPVKPPGKEKRCPDGEPTRSDDRSAMAPVVCRLRTAGYARRLMA